MRKLQVATLLTVLLLLLAACGGGTTTSSEGGTTAGSTGGGESAAPAPKAVTVEGTNELKYLPAELTAEVGQTLDITLQNTGVLEHNIVWDDAAAGEVFVLAAAGQSATASRTFDAAGEYGFHCTIPGHKEAGMVGTVAVSQ